MFTADGIPSTGTVVFNPTTGTGTLTADFDNDPSNGNEMINFSLVVNEDGTYDFTLDQVITPVVTLSTADGQLPAGGPDPVQTLIVGETNIVFFATDPLASQTVAPSIAEAIELGEPDLNEDELQSRSAMINIEGTGVDGTGEFPFINDNQLMNVSTSGIGVGNNVLNGDSDPLVTAGDESFVVNTEPLLTQVKVFIDNSVGGYDPGPESLYYTVYDELGNASGPILVEAADLSPEPKRQVSFTIDWDGTDFIDAVQLTMGEGAIKIPVIEFTAGGVAPPNDILLDFQATLTDFDDDTSTSDFEVNLFGDETEGNFDYILEGGTNPDAFNADEAGIGSQYLVQGFDVNEDEVVLLNLADGFTLETLLDLGVGTAGNNDSRITSDGGPLSVIVEDVTLTPDKISTFDTLI
jgi:hypothetical protein